MLHGRGKAAVSARRLCFFVVVFKYSSFTNRAAESCARKAAGPKKLLIQPRLAAVDNIQCSFIAAYRWQGKFLDIVIRFGRRVIDVLKRFDLIKLSLTSEIYSLYSKPMRLALNSLSLKRRFGTHFKFVPFLKFFPHWPLDLGFCLQAKEGNARVVLVIVIL